MTCDCLFWRSVDRLEEAADELVTKGFVLNTDRDACFAALVGVATKWGYQPPFEWLRLVGLGANSNAERKTIVEEYVRFSRAAKSDNERHEKLCALGVTKYQIHLWAKRFAPGALKAVNVPRYTVILEILRKQPWMTLPEIVGVTGLPRSTTISGLQKLWKRSLVIRRVGRFDLYEYSAADGVVRPKEETVTAQDKGAARAARKPRGRRVA